MALFLTHAAQLLTFAGPDRARRGRECDELGLIADGAVLIDQGRIIAVGETEALARRSESLAGYEEIDCRGLVVAPGLVDSHTHAVFPAPRLGDFEARIQGSNYEEIARAGGGISSTATRLRESGDEPLLAIAEAHLRALQAHGATTVEIKSGYGLSWEQEERQLRLAAAAARAVGIDAALTLLAAHALPAEYQERRGAYVDDVIERMLPAARASDLPIEFVDVFCERSAFTVAEAERIFRAAAGGSWRLKIHAEQLSATGATRMAVRCGAISADHLEYTAPEDHRALAAAETVATLLPGCDLFLGSRYPPARALLAAGAAVALATDFNPGTSPIPSLPLVMGLGCTQMGLSPAQVWTAVTINAAAALGRAEIVGSLMPGKRANLALFAADDYRAIPYYMGANLCTAVVQAGRLVPVTFPVRFSAAAVAQISSCPN